ncbi:MAG TPA: GNAT family protein [Aliidongia sp.]|nr:GNAT family protein [Aliidongia sp.]
MPFTFRRPTLADAEMLLDWRTRPEITRFMLTDIENDIEQQRRWLATCETRRDYEHFIVLRAELPIGYVSYAQIDRVSRHCVPGTYMVLEPAERHLASYTNTFILDYCFYRMDMNKAIFTIMAENERFIRAKHMAGVRLVGILKDHVWKYGQFHDLHMFEQTRGEWEATKRIFRREHTLAAFPS